MKGNRTRLTSFIMSLALLLSLATPAFATEEKTDNSLQVLETIAYMDINTAPLEMQGEILSARNIIAYTKEWVADGSIGWVEDTTSGEIIRYLPCYSEVFPGWDLPVNFTSTQTQYVYPSDIYGQGSNRVREWTFIESLSTYLEQPTDGTNADPFLIVVNRNSYLYLRAYAESLTSSKTCNIGFMDMSSGESLGYAMNLTLKEAFSCDSFGHQYIGIRASTHSTPGWANMAVEGVRI